MLIDIKLCHVTENALYCVVNGIFHRNIHSDKRFIGTPPKEVLYLDVGIAKKCFCCKTSTFFGIKSEELFLPKQNWNMHAYWKCYSSVTQEKHAVLIYASLTNYTPLETFIMSLAKMFFRRHLNDMPVRRFFDELKLYWINTEHFKKRTDGGITVFSLQLRYR